MAMETADEYVKNAPGERHDVPIYLVQAGNEPPTFTTLFHGWDVAKAKTFHDPYIARLSQLRERIGSNFRSTIDLKGLTSTKVIEPNLNTKVVEPPKEAEKPKPKWGSSAKPKQQSQIAVVPEDAKWKKDPQIELEKLKKKPFPEGVDVNALQRHLPDDDFHRVFKMGRNAFEKLVPWKQLNLRKDIGLY